MAENTEHELARITSPDALRDFKALNPLDLEEMGAQFQQEMASRLLRAHQDRVKFFSDLKN